MLLSGKVFFAGFSGLLKYFQLRTRNLPYFYWYFCDKVFLNVHLCKSFVEKLLKIVGISSSEYGRLNDIMYTQCQIAELENQGINTDTFLVDRPFPLAEKRAMKKHRENIIFDPKSTKKAFTYCKNSLKLLKSL